MAGPKHLTKKTVAEVCGSRGFRLIGMTGEQDHELHFECSSVVRLVTNPGSGLLRHAFREHDVAVDKTQYYARSPFRRWKNASSTSRRKT